MRKPNDTMYMSHVIWEVGGVLNTESEVDSSPEFDMTTQFWRSSDINCLQYVLD